MSGNDILGQDEPVSALQQPLRQLHRHGPAAAGHEPFVELPRLQAQRHRARHPDAQLVPAVPLGPLNRTLLNPLQLLDAPLAFLVVDYLFLEHLGRFCFSIDGAWNSLARS